MLDVVVLGVVVVVDVLTVVDTEVDVDCGVDTVVVSGSSITRPDVLEHAVAVSTTSITAVAVVARVIFRTVFMS